MTWLALRAGKVNRMMCADWLSSRRDEPFFPLRIGRLAPSIRKTWRLKATLSNYNCGKCILWTKDGMGSVSLPWVGNTKLKCKDCKEECMRFNFNMEESKGTGYVSCANGIERKVSQRSLMHTSESPNSSTKKLMSDFTTFVDHKRKNPSNKFAWVGHLNEFWPRK